MPDVNLSAVLYAKDDLRLEERPIPEPTSDQVQISVQSVGICGSDVHYWKNGAIGHFVLKAPMMLGHESSGVVTKVGANVTHLKPGDRIAIEPGVPCRRCEFCKIGRYNLCADIEFLATPPYDGDLARFHTHDASFCYKIPDNVSFDEAAMLEPLSVAVHACRRAGVTIGHQVFVCGAGPIGLLCMLTARAMGASSICVSDISENRLEVAKKLGASSTLCVKAALNSKELAEKVEELLGDKPDVSVECSGAESSIQSAIYATKSGGVLVLVGLGKPEVNLPIVDAAIREVDIRGVFRYANCYPVALSMIASGSVDVKPLITHHFGLENSLDAFETARTGAGGAIKVIIDCSKK